LQSHGIAQEPHLAKQLLRVLKRLPCPKFVAISVGYTFLCFLFLSEREDIMIHPMLFLMVTLGYAIAFFLLGLYTDARNSDESKASFGSFELPLPFSYRQLFVLSLLGLYLEMLMIRWLSSEIRIFAYYKNLVLIACFLGFGLGCALCRRRVHPLAMAIPLLFFTIFVAAPLPGMHDAVVNLTTLIGTTSQVQIWNVPVPATALDYTALAAAIAAVASLFGCIVFTFVPIGQVVGAMLETAPRGPRAYTINVAGSLVGILLYTLMCFLYQPPAIWFLVAAMLFGVVFLQQRKAVLIFLGTCLLVAAALTLWVDNTARVYWSPYQKLALTPVRSNNEVVAYWLNTNDSFYQQILNLSPDFLERHKNLLAGEDLNWNPYNIPYRFKSSPRSVLVLGAGMGNDVAAALRNTTAQVTAVEIDPLILKLGEILHFEHPYQSARVRIINDDARSYIQNSPDKFDLILFSLLDSHTTASSYSNIRIDNFVYTREAMSRARALLSPDGLMIVKFQVGSAWIGERISGLIQQAFHQAPFQVESASRYGTGGSFYIIGSAGAMRQISQDTDLAHHVSLPHESHATLTTDDWPYFYQKDHGLPAAVLGMGGFLICLSWYMIRRMTGRKRSGGSPMWSLHFFLLGAGFMLLEAQIVSKMALLFGTTWVVNSIVVSGLLALVVIANLIFERWPSYSMAIPYAGIILSAMLAYFIPLRTLLFESVSLRTIVATLLLCMPILFAGMVFVRSFADMRFSGEALGWNLFGAVLGGMLETVSQATGIRALLLMTVGLYLGSWIARNKAGTLTFVDTPVREEQAVLAEVL
jgi:spermidine synthase